MDSSSNLNKNTKETPTAYGTVVEALPNTLFRVRIDTVPVKKEDGSAVAEPEPILAYLAGKMRMHHIRVLIGDKVELALDPYGGRARITRRM